MTSLSWKIDKNGDASEDLPACFSCRKRKLRCSREAPVCYHCNKTGLECVYESKQKPGIKQGAVEALNRRIAVLEQILLDRDGDPIVTFTPDGGIIGRDASTTQYSQPVSASRPCSAREPGQSCQNSGKRKYTEGDELGTQVDFAEINHLEQKLPSHEVLAKAVDYFCMSFHHWIPFLHKARCQDEIRKANLDSGFILVLHALVAVVLPHLSPDEVGLEPAGIERQCKISRDLVMQNALLNMSLPSLQALVILVFDDISNGQLSRSFPLIALITRAVDFLQLTVEPGAPRSRSLMKPLSLLPPAPDWTELESRRRLFWCIFLLDRYHSAHTGWNTSLPSEDVHRRLPADGRYFNAEKSVLCPYFGLWNKSNARLSVCLAAHVPAKYNDEETSSDIANQASALNTASPGAADSSNLGAFAYCVEATESLNQVTTFFLQQRIDWQNKQDVVDWLARFKELDLRLVHWKIFLPPRWKDSNISVDKSLVDMDPNMTLAHMTHNTSMILLHYPIAFPPAEWTNLVQIPSACSAETCQVAAVETAHIAEKFLRYTQIPLVNPQFSFCVFVAGKALLAVSQAARQQIIPEFNKLVGILWTISNRWTGHHSNHLCRDYVQDNTRAPPDIAGRYADFLQKILQKCEEDPGFQFDFLDHSCDDLTPVSRTPVHVSSSILTNETSQNRSKLPSHASRQDHHRVKSARNGVAVGTKRQRNSSGRIESGNFDHVGYESSHGNVQQPSSSPDLDHHHPTQKARPHGPYQPRGAPPVPEASPSIYAGDGMSLGYFSSGNNTLGLVNTAVESQDHQQLEMHDQGSIQDSLLMLSDALMDPQYMELDRVITFEDANFHVPQLGPGWSS